MQGRQQYLDATAPAKKKRDEHRLIRIEENLKKKIDEYRAKLLESREYLNISPDNVRAAVDLGLELAGQPPLEKTELPGLHGDDEKVPAYIMPQLRGVWAACAEGLEHPHTEGLDGLPNTRRDLRELAR